MKLVIDTNCIISSLIKNGWSRRIIVSPAITHVAPEFTLKEITNHKDLITKKTNSSDKEFFLLMELLFTNIDIIPNQEYNSYLTKAAQYIEDPDDVPFVTQFFSTTADGIWSDDHHFKKQSKIPIYRTKELVRIFKD